MSDWEKFAGGNAAASSGSLSVAKNNATVLCMCECFPCDASFL